MFMNVTLFVEYLHVNIINLLINIIVEFREKRTRLLNIFFKVKNNILFELNIYFGIEIIVSV